MTTLKKAAQALMEHWDAGEYQNCTGYMAGYIADLQKALAQEQEAIKQAYLDGVASGIAAERKACIDICDKIEKEAYRMYRKNLDQYEDGVSAGARACMEEIARRK